MADIDKARAQRDALRNVAGRRTAGPSRAERALERYLGVGLYEARHGHAKQTTDEDDADRSSDTAPTNPEPPTGTIAMPLQAGTEMQALARFHRDVTWTGTIEAGALGPDSPPMTATGGGVHRLIQDGLWITGDYWQDQFRADGSFVLRWQLHWVAGWDPQAKEYRATIADNYGHTEILQGWIDGDLLTFQTIGRQPVRIRLFWHLVDDATMTWRNEASVNDGPFQLVERYVCHTTAPAPTE